MAFGTLILGNSHPKVMRKGKEKTLHKSQILSQRNCYETEITEFTWNWKD